MWSSLLKLVYTDSGATQPPELSTGLHWGQTEAPETTTSLSSYSLCCILPPSLSFKFLLKTVSALAQEAPSQVLLLGTEPRFIARLRTQVFLIPKTKDSLIRNTLFPRDSDVMGLGWGKLPGTSSVQPNREPLVQAFAVCFPHLCIWCPCCPLWLLQESPGLPSRALLTVYSREAKHCIATSSILC